MDRVPRPRLLCGAVSTSAGQSSPMQPVIQSFLPSGRLFRRSQLRWYAVKADHTVMWSGVNVSWPVFADATCYSVVPAIRKTISSFAIAMVCGEGGSHSATVVPAVGRSRLRSSGQWRFWWTSLSRLPRQLRAGRFLSCFRRLTEFRVVLRFRDSFGVSREPLPRRRRLGLTPSGPRRWWRGRGGPLLWSPSGGRLLGLLGRECVTLIQQRLEFRRTGGLPHLYSQLSHDGHDGDAATTLRSATDAIVLRFPFGRDPQRRPGRLTQHVPHPRRTLLGDMPLAVVPLPRLEGRRG